MGGETFDELTWASFSEQMFFAFMQWIYVTGCLQIQLPNPRLFHVLDWEIPSNSNYSQTRAKIMDVGCLVVVTRPENLVGGGALPSLHPKY